MSTSPKRGIKPIQFVRLLRLAVNKRASLQDRSWATTRMMDAKEFMRYEEIAQTIKRLAHKNSRLRVSLEKGLQEIFSAP